MTPRQNGASNGSSSSWAFWAQAPDAPKARAKRANTDQLPLFGARSAESRGNEEVLETLRALDLDRVTGLEALQFLARLKQKL